MRHACRCGHRHLALQAGAVGREGDAQGCVEGVPGGHGVVGDVPGQRGQQAQQGGNAGGRGEADTEDALPGWRRRCPPKGYYDTWACVCAGGRGSIQQGACGSFEQTQDRSTAVAPSTAGKQRAALMTARPA